MYTYIIMITLEKLTKDLRACTQFDKNLSISDRCSYRQHYIMFMKWLYYLKHCNVF